MVEDRQDIIRRKIESHLDYFLSTSDDAQKQIYFLLSVDLGVENPPLDILLSKMRGHENSLLNPLIEVLFSFEYFKSLAIDESVRESPMLRLLFYQMDICIIPSWSETPNITFDPWPWLDYYLNDSAKETVGLLSPNEPLFAGTEWAASICALLYASLYCNLDTEQQNFSKFLNLFETKYGVSRRLAQCQTIFEGRLDGHSLIKIFDWFD